MGATRLMDMPTAVSSGPALIAACEPTVAATAVSSGPPSTRRAGCWRAPTAVPDDPPSIASTSTIAAVARSAISAESAATLWARSWLRVESVGLVTCDMTTSLVGADGVGAHTLAPDRPAPVTKSSRSELSWR